MSYNTARIFSNPVPDQANLESFYRSSRRTIRSFRKKQLIRVLKPLHSNN